LSLVRGGLGRWAAGLLLTAWACLAPAAEPAMERVIGASPAQAFYLAEAFRELRWQEDADLLTRYLLYAYVDELEGKPHDPALRVSDALVQARQLPEVGRAVDLRQRWRKQVARALIVTAAQSPRELPRELDTMAGQLVAKGPGLWAAMQGEHPRILYLAVTAVSHAAVPLPVGEFDLLLSTFAGGEPLKLRCTPEAPRAVKLLLPQQPEPFLCQSFAIPAADERWDPFTLLAQAREQPQRMQVDVRQLDEARSAQEAVRALANLHRDEVEKLVASAAPQPAVAPAPALLEPPTEKHSYARARILFVLGAATILAVYFLLAHALGNRRAAVLVGVTGTILVLAFIAVEGLPSGGWEMMAVAIIYAMALVVPGSAAAVLFSIYAGYEHFRDDQRPFRVKAFQAAVGLLVLLLFTMLSLDD
jgi:hypothetical protein